MSRKLTRGIRSPEDHAILEAEYEKNSKPDKAARLDIVKRVALGEKEVQVSGTRTENSLPPGVWIHYYRALPVPQAKAV